MFYFTISSVFHNFIFFCSLNGSQLTASTADSAFLFLAFYVSLLGLTARFTVCIAGWFNCLFTLTDGFTFTGFALTTCFTFDVTDVTFTGCFTFDVTGFAWTVSFTFDVTDVNFTGCFTYGAAVVSWTVGSRVTGCS